MTSAIDPTKPTAGEALTQDVRDNFNTASIEISNLQANLSNLQMNITTLNQQVAALQAMLLSFGRWNWQGTPQDTIAGIVSGGIGIDTTSETTATTLFISDTTVDGFYYWNQLGVMKKGDGFLINNPNGDTIRYTINAGQTDHGGYFTFPVTFVGAGGWEPTGGTWMNVQMLFSGTPAP